MFFKKSNEQNSPLDYIIVGLGNPGEKYKFNRHNAGFMSIDYLSQKLNVKVNKIKFKSLCCDTVINNHRVLLMKPQTFMNLSGDAIHEAAVYYKIPIEKIIVIFDDIHIDIGSLRIKRKGSDGGHNGLKSIIQNFQADNFPRVKIGVGNPPPETELMNWVLKDIPKADQKSFFETIEKSYDAISLIINDEIDRAMNLYN